MIVCKLASVNPDANGLAEPEKSLAHFENDAFVKFGKSFKGSLNILLGFCPKNTILTG